MAKYKVSMRSSVHKSGPDFTSREYWEKEIAKLSLHICKNSLSPMKAELNNTEMPDPDPRKSFVDVRRWKTEILGTRWYSGTFRTTIRARNTQSDTSYKAYRIQKAGRISHAQTINDPTQWSSKRFQRTFSYPRKRGRLSVVSVNVPIGNIAFSRTYSPKRKVIRPSKTKYRSDSYAKCLKIWTGSGFIYKAYVAASKDNSSYRESRFSVMRKELAKAVYE